MAELELATWQQTVKRLRLAGWDVQVTAGRAPGGPPGPPGPPQFTIQDDMDGTATVLTLAALFLFAAMPGVISPIWWDTARDGEYPADVWDVRRYGEYPQENVTDRADKAAAARLKRDTDIINPLPEPAGPSEVIDKFDEALESAPPGFQPAPVVLNNGRTVWTFERIPTVDTDTGQIFDTAEAADAAAPPGFRPAPVVLNNGKTVWTFERVEPEAPSGLHDTWLEANREAVRVGGFTGKPHEAVYDPETGQFYVAPEEEVPEEGQIFSTHDEAFDAAPEGFQPIQLSDGMWVFERVEGPQNAEELRDQYLMDWVRTGNAGALDNAQKIFNFINQPTSQARLDAALAIAQSPSDFFTLQALLTGRMPPADAGGEFGRIAPLDPILQRAADEFFGPIGGPPTPTGPVVPSDGVITPPTDGAPLTPIVPGDGQPTGPVEDPRLAALDPAERAAVVANAPGLTQQVRTGITQEQFDAMPDPANEEEAAKKRAGLPYQTIHGFNFVPTPDFEVSPAPDGTPPILGPGEGFEEEEAEGTVAALAALGAGARPTALSRLGATSPRPHTTTGASRALASDGAGITTGAMGQGQLFRLGGGESVSNFLTAPQTRQFPGILSEQGKTDFPRFRSQHTQRRQGPIGRGLFEGQLRTLGIPPEAFREQELAATGGGAPRRGRLGTRFGGLRRL